MTQRPVSTANTDRAKTDRAHESQSSMGQASMGQASSGRSGAGRSSAGRSGVNQAHTPYGPQVPRGRAQRKPAPRAAWALRETLARLKSGRGPSCAELMLGWGQIAGDRLALLTRPVKLTNPGPRGTLHISADGAAAVLVEADARRILQRANMFCGQDVACRIAVTRAASGANAKLNTSSLKNSALKDSSGRHDRPGPTDGAGPAPARLPAMSQGLSMRKARALERKLEPICDPGLKEALRALGRAVMASEPSGGGAGSDGGQDS